MPPASLRAAAAVGGTLAPVPLRDSPLFNRTRAALPLVGSERVHEPVRRNTRALRRLGLALSAGPELTRARSGTDPRVALRVGLTARAFVAERWSVDLGAHRVRKDYYAPSGAYRAEPGFWAGDLPAEQTWAESRVWDFPLAVSYYAEGRAHSGAVLTAGLSSYLVTLQTFDFDYAHDVAGQVDHLDMRDLPERNLFGIAHLAAGYRLVPRRGPVLRLEAYGQLPLTGVGYGDIAVYSAGLRVGVELR